MNAAEITDEACRRHNYDDWYLALLHTAIDETGDLREAIKVADAAYEENPTSPVEK